jgi:hypothetical protein
VAPCYIPHLIGMHLKDNVRDSRKVRFHEAIKQSLEFSFETIFAGAIKIRRRGLEESVDAVRRQFSKWVAGRFSESADVHC